VKHTEKELWVGYKEKKKKKITGGFLTEKMKLSFRTEGRTTGKKREKKQKKETKRLGSSRLKDDHFG